MTSIRITLESDELPDVIRREVRLLIELADSLGVESEYYYRSAGAVSMSHHDLMPAGVSALQAAESAKNAAKAR